MKNFAFGLLLGCSSLWFYSELPSILFWVAGVVLSVIAYRFCRHFRSTCTPVYENLLRSTVLFALAFSLGSLWATLMASYQLSFRLPVTSERIEVRVSGQVCSIPKRSDSEKGSSSRFFFCLAANNESIDYPIRKLLLSWYYTERMPQVGEFWNVTARLKTPYAKLNPGTFDFERWALTEQIDATGYVVEGARIHGEFQFANINQWRAELIEVLQQATAKTEYQGWHLALTAGYREMLSDEHLDTLKRSGTAHLIAISGLHVGLVFLWAFSAVNFLWRRSARLCLWIPAERVSILCALLLTTGFSLMAGFDTPTQRALVALTILSISRLTLMEWSHFSLLSLTLIVLLLLDPLSVLSEGFWLSIIALVMIYWLAGSSRDKGLVFWLKLQAFLSIGMAVVASLMFGIFSINSIVANILAIPIISFVVLPLDLIGYLVALFHVEAASVLFSIADYPLRYLLQFLHFLNQLFSSLFLSQSFAMLLLIGVGCFFTGWILRHRLVVVLCVSSFLVVCIGYVLDSAEKGMSVHFIDVGQGQSILVQYEGFNALYDTGFANDEFSTAQQIIAPYLYSLGVSQLDVLIISHKDVDHSGDLEWVIKQFNPKSIYFGEATRGNAENCSPQLIKHRDMKLQTTSVASYHSKIDTSDKASFATINLSGKNAWQGNNSSCLARFTLGEQSILLTGDIEEIAERELIKQNQFPLQADVISVPHHGSKTSSTWSFLVATKAAIGVVSNGYLNRFNHPAISVISRYEALDISTLNTADTGRLLIEFDGQGTIDVSAHRSESGKFWNHTLESRILQQSVIN
ncbi:DNA internalization-related competence protein ComEC/Rec2 [Pleionea sediminis]|uniref:DNA internalization-related competence protein ComEC/Rec2 n=1 Tax=Pleionea sediminis TaxID=2569479 RepID=UPI0011858B33|nr:DNA internalization-related competence protein ComEC/Rec2 [Pleionea sediminis]